MPNALTILVNKLTPCLLTEIVAIVNKSKNILKNGIKKSDGYNKTNKKLTINPNVSIVGSK